MKKYILKNFKKIVVISSILIFLTSFLFFLTLSDYQRDRLLLEKYKLSHNLVSQIFDHDDIEKLINHEEGSEYILEKLNSSFDSIEKSFSLGRRDVILAEKKGGTFFLIFVKGINPSKEFKKRIKDEFNFRKIPFKGGKKYFLLIRFTKKFYPSVPRAFLFSFVILFFVIASFWIVFKERDKKFDVFENMEKLLPIKNLEEKLKGELDFYRAIEAYMRRVNELLLSISTYIEQVKLENYRDKMKEGHEFSLKLYEDEEKILADRDEITSEIKNILDRTDRNLEIVGELSEKSLKDVLDKGIKFLEELDLSIQKIDETDNELRNLLNNSRNAINNIVEIAEQTHLISINAAIEASGEEGNKRFSVVAGEMRKLSVEIKNATVVIQNSFDIVEKSFNKERLILNNALKESQNKLSELLSAIKESSDKDESLFKQLTLELRETKFLLNNLHSKVEARKKIVSDINFFAKTISEKMANLNNSYEKSFSLLQRIEKKVSEVKKNV